MRKGIVLFFIGLVIYTITVFGIVTVVTYIAEPLQQYATLYVGCRLLQILPVELLALLVIFGAISFTVLAGWGWQIKDR